MLDLWNQFFIGTYAQIPYRKAKKNKKEEKKKDEDADDKKHFIQIIKDEEKFVVELEDKEEVKENIIDD